MQKRLATEVAIELLFMKIFHSQQFNVAAQKVKQLSKAPSEGEMKEIYALYRQATIGDVNTGEQEVLCSVDNF